MLLQIIYRETMHKTMGVQPQLLQRGQQRIGSAIGFLSFFGGGGFKPARAVAGNANGFAQLHQHDAASQRFLTAKQISGGRFAGQTGQIHACKHLRKRAIPDEDLIARAMVTRDNTSGRGENKAKHGKRNEHKQQEQRKHRCWEITLILVWRRRRGKRCRLRRDLRRWGDGRITMLRRGGRRWCGNGSRRRRWC